MKPLILMVLASVIFITSTRAQNTFEERPLTPARAYYKQLITFKSAPNSSNEGLDKLKFDLDAASAERRLSLKPYYLENITLSDFKIPDPPANSSEQTRAELNYLLLLQQQRSDLDVQSSLHMAGIFYNIKVKPEDSTYHAYRANLFFIGRTLGTWFNPNNLPLTANLVANVWRDASYFIWSMKYKYLRVRPYILDPALNNLEDTNWPAYPSGHAANSYINAFLYQELAPEFTDVFQKDAYDMAHSREIIGVHYPSDSEASRIFARQFVNKLFRNKKFLKDFELVKKEWTEKARESFTKPAGISKTAQAPSCQSAAAIKKCQ